MVKVTSLHCSGPTLRPCSAFQSLHAHTYTRWTHTHHTCMQAHTHMQVVPCTERLLRLPLGDALSAGANERRVSPMCCWQLDAGCLTCSGSRHEVTGMMCHASCFWQQVDGCALTRRQLSWPGCQALLPCGESAAAQEEPLFGQKRIVFLSGMYSSELHSVMAAYRGSGGVVCSCWFTSCCLLACLPACRRLCQLQACQSACGRLLCQPIGAPQCSSWWRTCLGTTTTCRSRRRGHEACKRTGLACTTMYCRALGRFLLGVTIGHAVCWLLGLRNVLPCAYAIVVDHYAMMPFFVTQFCVTQCS